MDRPAFASAFRMLEPDGRLLCAGRSGARLAVHDVSDGAGGRFLITHDTMVDPDNPPDGWLDVGVIHLDSDLRVVPMRGAPGSDDPCGALLVGGGNHQLARSAASWNAGGILLVGLEIGEAPYSGNLSRIFVQAFDATGSALFGSVPLFPAEPSTGSTNSFGAPDGRGGVLLGWQQEFAALPATSFFPNGPILVQRFDGGGNPLWPAPVRVSLDGLPDSFFASLVADGEGGAYVSWVELRGGEPDPSVHPRLQHVDAAGRPLWQAGGLRVDPSRLVSGAVTLLADARGVLAVFNGDTIRAQLFSPEGERLWGTEGVPLATSGSGIPARDPLVSAADDGNLVVTWSERGIDGLWRRLARRLRRDGSSPWPAAVMLAAGPESFDEAAQTLLPEGSLAFTWLSLDNLSGNRLHAIAAQMIDARGRIKAGPGGESVIRATAPNAWPRVFPSAAGPHATPEVSIFWGDRRPGIGVAGADNFFLQRMGFTSAPRIDPPAATTASAQGGELTLRLEGDDLQPGAHADLGPGVAVLAAQVEPILAEGPGDRLTLRLRVDSAAAVGARELGLTNPDGSWTTLPGALNVELDVRRIDIDGSGRADGFDLALLAGAFGRARGEAGYEAGADIDGSGQVDGRDLALLAGRFGDLF